MLEKVNLNLKKIEKNPINLDSELIYLKRINGASIEQKEHIVHCIEKELAWLDSDEYTSRKKEATGMSESQIKKDISKIKEQLAKTVINILDEDADLALGVYSQDKNNPIINIFRNYESEELTLSTLDHEVKHMCSEQALETMDDLVKVFCSNYKKYPKINNKKIVDYLIPVGETSGRWASNAPEQQVISKRIMDIIEEDRGIKRGTKLTVDDLKLLIDDLKSSYNNRIKNNDIITMLHAMKQKHKDSYMQKLCQMVNKAY